MKVFSLLLIILMANTLFAQTENDTLAINNFEANYNAEKYTEIFDSFSLEMKQALPLENTKQFLRGLKTQAGKIESKEFIKIQQETYATYKTTFQKAILVVNISLDDQNKINGLFIKPFEESNETKTKTINALNSYPKEIAAVIYASSKDFPTNTQLSIAVIHNDSTSFYGVIKENDSLKSAENQTKVFEIGSITKVFTSSVLASLLKDQKINLADNINAYYPFTFKDNININFENLANHTSGLPRLPQNLDLSNASNPYRDYGEKELDDYLKELLKIENKPLKMYSYSNLGAGLLGYTLGLSQNTSFQKLLQKNIFDKYGMTNSFTSPQDLENKLVKGQDLNGDIISNWDFDVLFGGGGILSTTEDLAKFANAQFNPKNKELALTRKSTFTINDKMEIGLGWHILKSENDKDVFWHNGGTGGYSSSIAVNVDDKTAVIILSNAAQITNKMDDLCLELMAQTKNNEFSQ